MVYLGEVNILSFSRSGPLVLVLLGVLLLGTVPSALAHNPTYVGDQIVITIPDPEVSKAYYGELTGTPAVYRIESDKAFSFYLNILVPDVPGATKDFSATVTNDEGQIVTTLDGLNVTWEPWYEEFAGDTYWKGPEYRENVPAGTYVITVSNPTNIGKYVLAPGEIEAFTLAGIPSTIQELYLTKTEFFGKPWYALFEGVIGKSLLGILTIFGILVLVSLYILRRRLTRVRS